MSELRELHQRLESALGRLDAAVETRLQQRVSQDQIDTLARQLAAANAENERLQETTDTVARRLDDAIDRIRAILGD